MKDLAGKSFREIDQRGGGLLELLLALAVFMSLLPFIYNFAAKRMEQAENTAIVRKIEIVRESLEKYVEDNRQKFLAPVSKNVTRVSINELILPKNEEIKNARIQLRVVKSKDSAGRAFVQGIVIFDSPELTPLRTRQIAQAAGENSGFADGNMLYGSFGTWRTLITGIDAAAGSHSILSGTRPLRSGGDYLRRLPSDNDLDATMQSDLDMGGHGIENAKNITASRARFLEALEADTIEASKMSVSNRLDWAAPLEVFGEATVMGPITADSRSIDASAISVSGRSQFRSVTADELKAENLYLSGFSVAPAVGTPAVLSISGSLDMVKGHVKAIDTFVEFSGSVAPKLIVSGRIEDSSNSSFYWNLSGGDAALGDMQLSNLNQIIKQVYLSERTGKTETEYLMGNVIMNSNSTVSDYIRALEQVKRVVENKYLEIKDFL